MLKNSLFKDTKVQGSISHQSLNSRSPVARGLGTAALERPALLQTLVQADCVATHFIYLW